MQADILEKLLGSAQRPKIIRLFLLNPEELFTLKEISRRSRVTVTAVRREISVLERIGFIKKKIDAREEVTKLKSGKLRLTNKKINGYVLDDEFPLLVPLKGLVLSASPVGEARIAKMLRESGTVKLIIVTGFFLQQDDSRVDILLVGDGISKAKVDRKLKEIEADVGKELNYTALTTDEFNYRIEMCDKFVSDILEHPHKKILNRLGL